jgi:uncharacterized protein (TIGR00251 family)
MVNLPASAVAASKLMCVGRAKVPTTQACVNSEQLSPILRGIFGGAVALTIQPHPEGATLALRVQPKARRNAITGERAGALKVSVTAPPEDGRANDAVLALLRDEYDLQRSQVELLSGQTNRN